MFRTMWRERSRRRAVKRLGVLGTIAEPALDRFVEQAATAFAAPIALLTLIHDDLLTVHASRGVPVQCVPRGDSFCTHAVDRGPDVFEVCDAIVDPAVRHLPAVVGEPHVRYYIGAPLILQDGTHAGALCVLDIRPRVPAAPDQRAYLTALARHVAAALERDASLHGGLPHAASSHGEMAA